MYTLIINTIKAGFQAPEKSSRGVYLSLYESIRKTIETGLLPEGSILPPTRILAEEMGLSRSTVVKSYSLLTENQLLSARQGSGFVVNRINKPVTKQKPEQTQYPAISEVGQSYLKSIHLLIHTQTEGTAFTPGLPPLDIFPIGQWQKLTNMYWRHIKSSDLNYSISSGIDSLKRNIANYLLISRKIKADPQQIIIVAGSLQSLYLIGNVLIDKGDGVYLENPTFPNVISIFKSLRAEVMPINTDKDGLLVSEMQARKNERVKIVHTSPSNQYPLGGKMSLERRHQLLSWASENSAIIIENDYEHEINNWHDPIPAIFSLDQEQRTIYLGTFNRILHPSIRLGYMVLPPYIIPAIKALQMHSHRFVPQSVQAVMSSFMEQNLLLKHIRNVIDEAAERKSLFLNLIDKYFDEPLNIRPSDIGSFHLLAQMPDEQADEKLVSALEAKGITTHPLSKCYVGEPKKQGLIMGYSCVNRGFMAQFVLRMAGVCNGKGW